MLFKSTLFLLLVTISTLFSQKIGVWKNYTNTDNVTDVSATGDGFWIATTGGAMYYSNTTNKFELFLTNSEGLSNQNVTAINTDSNGNVWLGMQNGMINIYNTISKKTTPIKDIYGKSYTKKKITSILIKEDIAYITTEFGLSLLNTNDFTFISSTLKFGNLLNLTPVVSVSVEDKIYVATTDGVAIEKMGNSNLVAPESWSSFENGKDLDANKTYATTKYNNSLIAATDKGLLKFDGTSWSKYYYSSPVLDFEIYNNKLFVLFENSLHSYNGTTDEIIYSTTEQQFHKLEITSNGTYLIASSKGTIKITGNSVEVLYPNGPVSNTFESLAVDKEGSLWIGTGISGYGSGFVEFSGGSWTNYNTTTMPELPNNNYHKVSADGSGVYLSNWGSGLTIENNGEFTHYNINNSELVGTPEHPSYIVIMNAERDFNGNLWIFNHASADGKPLIEVSTNSTWYHYRFPYFQLTEKVFLKTGTIDANNTKWFSVAGRGLYYFNEYNTPSEISDDTWGKITVSNSSLNSNEINALAVDNRGELWVGTTSGMNIISNTASPSSSITSVFSLRQQSISAIAIDPLNNKWVGTHQGLFVMNPDGTHLIAQYDSKNSPLPSDNISSIAIDNNSGIVYIGTSFGLSSLTTLSVKPKEKFDKIKTYPNPFVIGKHSSVAFDGLVKNSTLKILSVSGELVRELETPGGRISFWNGKDENGNFVPSGIYLLVAFDEGADKITTSKFAVIR